MGRKRKPAGGAVSQQSENSMAGGVQNPDRGSARSTGLFVLGAAFSALAAAMSGLLVIKHLWGMALPGCGPGGSCDQAAKSLFGALRIPSLGLEWPVAHLGLAYFLAAFGAWLVARGRFPRPLVYLVRLGALISLGFCAIIAVEKLACGYCLAAHVGNFAFWIVVELTQRRGRGDDRVMARRAAPTVATLGGVLILVSAGLGVAEAGARSERENVRAESGREIIEATHRPVLADTAPASAPETTSAPARGFTGRYRVGPEDAPIRIVMFTDHQCPDCKTIEGQVSELIRTRADVSVSIRYFPFNSDCNRHAPNNTRHPNACWAARAAEAAGMLWGAEGFWKMHSWLFAHDGRFETEAELLAGIRSLGYDPANFVATMTGPETLARVQADCEEAIDLGLFFTPMIFINGVEFRGWNVPNALARTVAEVAATNPPRRLPVHDVPARAREKFLADWRDWNGGQPITLPAEPHAWTLGPADARVRIVLWGDYQEPQTARHDQLIRRFMTGRNDVQYTYRHYPFNNECNRRVQSKRFPLACLAARAAEAAGQLGGNDGFWKMHAWLMDNQASVGAESLRAAAPQLGLDSAQLFGALTGAAGARHIYDDIEAGAQLPQLRHGAPPGVFGIPTVFVNGKYVPRLLLQGEPVLEEILMVAAAE